MQTILTISAEMRAYLSALSQIRANDLYESLSK
jgi:hypothetical protein